MYSDIKIVKGNGGYGGPLIIRPTKVKHKFIYAVSYTHLRAHET